jgi:probable HAF family extracellular repeat protein
MRNPIARILVATVVLLVGVAGGSAGASQHDVQPDYTIQVLDSLDGTASGGISINNRGWVAGWSNEAGDATVHATLWRNGSIDDLGTLGGPNSAVLWPVKNETGLLVGVSETAEVDPLDEDWSCSVFFPGDPTDKACVGFVWKRGEMRALPTLGGTHGFAAGANNRGQVVGWAENNVFDPTCNEPQELQFRGVVWDTTQDPIQVKEMPPFPGDTVSTANAINNRGQVVGISGICSNAVGGFSAIRAVMWDNGTVIDLGNLGGVAWNTPMAINDRGDVVGFGNTDPDAGDTFGNEHAFLWTKSEGIKDLGTLPGDVRSQALGINNRGQIVGQSCTAPPRVCRAFLWEDEVMTDLTEQIASGFDGRLAYANDINDRGEITGGGVDASTGEVVAYVATPTHGRGRR